MNLSIFSVEYILSSFLIFVRIAALIGTAPFFNGAAFPNRVKLFFSFALTIMMYPLLPEYGNLLSASATSFEVLLAVAREILVGVAMGLTGQIIFAGIRMGGELMSVNIGLSFASVVDPVNEGQNQLVSQFFSFLAVLIFLGIGGEAIYLRALEQSFHIVPVGDARVATAALSFFDIARYLFVIGVQISSPFIIVLFLLDLSFAIFARIMPQANIFFIALPLKVGVGVILMLLVLPYTPTALEHFFNQMWIYLGDVLQALVSQR